jgi:hypothetical protein
MEVNSVVLDNKVAIVTGGNSGIGRAIAVELAREGAALVINYVRDPAAAEALKQEIGQSGGQAITVQADVTQLADIQRLIDQAVQAFGRLDILAPSSPPSRCSNRAGAGGSSISRRCMRTGRCLATPPTVAPKVRCV